MNDGNHFLSAKYVLRGIIFIYVVLIFLAGFDVARFFELVERGDMFLIGVLGLLLGSRYFNKYHKAPLQQYTQHRQSYSRYDYHDADHMR